MPLLFKAMTLVLFLFKIWKRLPASQRRHLIWTVGRHGPRIATSVWRRSRTRA
jgi:hypothetical protein